MVSAKDVAKYILLNHGPMTTLKLQKLVYYSAAYFAAWAEEKLFREPVVAWTHGPVVYELFNEHRGKFTVSAEEISGDAGKLDFRSCAVIDSVLRALGGLSGSQLEYRTHQERPWLANYRASDQYHNSEIPFEMMRDYYKAH